MTTISQKVLIDIETKKAQKEMSNLARMSNDAGEAMHRMDSVAKDLQKSINLIKGPTSAFDTFKSGMKGVMNVMGPLNQGFELAGKVVRFAEAGLDAYAKTSAHAADEVRALKDEFAGWRDMVLSSSGEMTIALLKPALGIEATKKSLDELYKKYLTGGFTKMGDYLIGDDETKDPVMSLSNSLKGFNKTLFETTDHWNTDGKTFVDSFTAGMEKTAAATKKAAIENARWAAEFRAMQYGNDARNVADARAPKERAGYQIDQGMLGANAGITSAFDDLDAKQEQLSRAARYGESAGRRNDTYLASIFGPIDEFDAYKTAFETLGVATQTAMSAWISGSESLGAAIKKGIGAALAGLASQMAVEALKHGAYAIGSLAFGDVRGAGQHAAAAAAFGAGSVAAAVAAKALSGGSGSGGTGAAAPNTGGGASGGSTNRDQRTGGAGGAGKETVVIAYADPFADLSAREKQLTAERTWKRIQGGAGSTDS